MRRASGTMLGLFLGCALLQTPVLAQQPEPDNTRVNKQEQPTADQAKNHKNDRMLMRDVRRALMKEKNLSTDAKNVKLVAADGKITLRGPVRSEEEKKAVENAATQVAGAGNVVNMLSVENK